MTLTESAPDPATALAGTSAVSTTLLTKVVAKLLPFHCTLEPEMKFEPITLRVKAGPPCWLLFGDKAATAGPGLGGGPVELPPPHPNRLMAPMAPKRTRRGVTSALC